MGVVIFVCEVGATDILRGLRVNDASPWRSITCDRSSDEKERDQTDYLQALCSVCSIVRYNYRASRIHRRGVSVLMYLFN